MLDSFTIALLVGTLLGYLAALGIGGGSLLILWLTFMLGAEQSTARSINLMFFIAAAGAVSLFRWRQGKLQLRTILPAILCGCVSAALFSLLSTRLDVENLRKLFGIILIVTGIRELCYRRREFK